MVWPDNIDSGRSNSQLGDRSRCCRHLAAVELTLTQDELRQLDEVSALPPEYPGWVLPFQGADRLEPVDRWERFREAKKPH